MNVKDKLNRECEDKLDTLNRMQLNDEEYRNSASTVAQLTDRVIKMEELELKREEINLEKQKVDNSRKDNNFKNGIAIGTAVTGFMLTVGGIVASFVSEEKGIIHTTQAGKKSFDRALNYFFKR